MKVLFIHQNFPAQFKAIAERLAAQPGNEVLAFRQSRHQVVVQGVGVLSYRFLHRPMEGQHPFLSELEAKVLRAEAVAEAAARLKARGWNPDVMVVHPGWGEALMVKDVWPDAKLISYAEYFYATRGQDFNFDPEFPNADAYDAARLRFKNTPMLHALHESDAMWTSTAWQRSIFPVWAQPRIRVIHEGVDMDYYRPDPEASFTVAGKDVTLKAGDEVITYATRSLEPVRGFHVFMRALPAILKRRPNAHVLIVGKEEATYGPEPENHKSWLERMLKEVGPRLDPARVHITGFLPKEAYRRVLQVSAAHVYLTYPFVLSWSVVEALACGARLVGSRTGPVEEVMPPRSERYMFNFFDVPGVVDSVCAALERSPKQVEADRKAAREQVANEFSTDWQTRQLLELFDEVVTARSPLQAAAIKAGQKVKQGVPAIKVGVPKKAAQKQVETPKKAAAPKTPSVPKVPVTPKKVVSTKKASPAKKSPQLKKTTTDNSQQAKSGKT